MKTIKIGIAPLEAYKARTLAIARGELAAKKDDPKIWFSSTESFARVLTEKNRALLSTISRDHPSSLAELGELTGRAPSNLSRTLKTMEQFGLVILHRGARGRIRPEVPYQAIQLELTLTQPRRMRSTSSSVALSDRRS
jgi:predicted transcriptional regulator